MGQAESLFLNDEGEQRSQSHTGRKNVTAAATS